MYSKTIQVFVELSQQKARSVKSHTTAFFVGSALAGAYVGLGVILIFSVGSEVAPEYQKLVMGASFGIALTLVVIAGSELFTGHTLYMSLGFLERAIGPRDLVAVWSASWLGNLIGSISLALIFTMGGGTETLAGPESLLQSTAINKTSSPISELIARGALCNFLVCLALWMSARVDSDTAKCVVIFWCLFAFIASGYEHSVANMTLLSIAYIAQSNDAVSIFDIAHNLSWVTVGNIIGGAVFTAFGYWTANTQ